MMFQWYSADSVLGRHWWIAALEQRAALCSDYGTRLLQQLSLSIRRAHLPVDCVGCDRLESRMLWTEIYSKTLRQTLPANGSVKLIARRRIALQTVHVLLHLRPAREGSIKASKALHHTFKLLAIGKMPGAVRDRRKQNHINMSSSKGNDLPYKSNCLVVMAGLTHVCDDSMSYVYPRSRFF